MARPKKAEGQLMETRAFRAPPELWASLDRKAELSGLSGAEYFRRAILNDETVIQAVPKKSALDKEVLFLIKKISNNLNQLAHAINTAYLLGRMPQSLYEQLDASLTDIRRRLIATL